MKQRHVPCCLPLHSVGNPRRGAARAAHQRWSALTTPVNPSVAKKGVWKTVVRNAEKAMRFRIVDSFGGWAVWSMRACSLRRR